jgi:hypothetical protein
VAVPPRQAGRPAADLRDVILRLLAIVLVGALAAALAGQRASRAEDRAPVTADGDTVVVSAGQRDAPYRFSAAVSPADRAWIEAALARARPEAARLIGEVDGLVAVGALPAGTGALGIARGDAGGFAIDLDLERLDADRSVDRATVVLHEFGHVVDFALVPAALGRRLDAAIPAGGECGRAVTRCDARAERFADTFAKWALRGAVSEVGAGYGIPLPPSLEDWGAPLGRLAAGLPGSE